MSRFNELLHGDLETVLEHLDGTVPMSNDELRVVVANLAGKLQQANKRLEKLEARSHTHGATGPSVCAMRGCDEPATREGKASGAFCAVHERELRLEQEATDD